jgi:hypothetical protein
MRGAAAALWLAVAVGSTQAATLHEEAICDNPPCSREALERYARKVIKRLQKANKLSYEAYNRGEQEESERLNRVFRRNFERRRAVVAAIKATSD